MTDMEKILEKLKEHKSVLKRKFHVKRIGIFGSYSRGENEEESDLDVLVEFEPEQDFGLIGFVNLENYLTDLLGVKVDLVERSALKPGIGENILKEVVFT